MAKRRLGLSKWRGKQLVLPYNLVTPQEYADLSAIALSSAYRRALRGQIETVTWRGQQLFVVDMARDPDALVDIEAVIDYRTVNGDPLVNKTLKEEGDGLDIDEEEIE